MYECHVMDTTTPIVPGTEVEVQGRYDNRWTSGFRVADVADGGYRLRREVDGVVLPVRFRADDPPAALLTTGTEVEVRVRYDGSWARGFEIAHSDGGNYYLRRRSDGVVLPVPFPAVALRCTR